MRNIRVNRRNFIKASLIGGSIGLIGANRPCTDKGPCNSNPAALSRGERILGSGKFSLKVSSLGFGCMGMTYNRSSHPDAASCIKLIRNAVKRGITLFDTAIVYARNNEELVGEALEPFRGDVSIATKFGHEVINGKGTGRLDSRPKTVKRYCEESLRRLKVECIDLFYQHRFDPNVPIEDVAGAIKELMSEGKIKRWGLCEVSAEIIAKAHKIAPLTAIQSEYHLMWRKVEENGVLQTCNKLGIGFVAYSPINRGFLGGNINEYTKFDPPSMTTAKHCPGLRPMPYARTCVLWSL